MRFLRNRQLRIRVGMNDLLMLACRGRRGFDFLLPNVAGLLRMVVYDPERTSKGGSRRLGSNKSGKH